MYLIDREKKSRMNYGGGISSKLATVKKKQWEWPNNTQTETCCKDANWIELTQNRFKWTRELHYVHVKI
jgi:hypothetical protein